MDQIVWEKMGLKMLCIDSRFVVLCSLLVPHLWYIWCCFHWRQGMACKRWLSLFFSFFDIKADCPEIIKKKTIVQWCIFMISTLTYFKFLLGVIHGIITLDNIAIEQNIYHSLTIPKLPKKKLCKSIQVSYKIEVPFVTLISCFGR